nr:hypothetical protein CFP56_21018 [Quercus suber]
MASVMTSTPAVLFFGQIQTQNPGKKAGPLLSEITVQGSCGRYTRWFLYRAQSTRFVMSVEASGKSFYVNQMGGGDQMLLSENWALSPSHSSCTHA